MGAKRGEGTFAPWGQLKGGAEEPPGDRAKCQGTAETRALLTGKLAAWPLSARLPCPPADFADTVEGLPKLSGTTIPTNNEACHADETHLTLLSVLPAGAAGHAKSARMSNKF